MRELTEYEKKKWFGEHEFDSLEDLEFLTYGDELGEAFDAAVYCTDKRDYGLSDEFVKHAQVEALDMYYDQIHLYTGEYGGYDTPESLGLPSREEFYEKARELGVEKIPWIGTHMYEDKHRELWDWALDWRRSHITEFTLRQREERLQRELDAIRQQKA